MDYRNRKDALVFAHRYSWGKESGWESIEKEKSKHRRNIMKQRKKQDSDKRLEARRLNKRNWEEMERKRLYEHHDEKEDVTFDKREYL